MFLAQYLAEAFTVHVFHCQEYGINIGWDGGSNDVVYAADVRMRNLPGCPYFGTNFKPLRMTGKARRENLKGNGLIKRKIVCPVNVSHPALTDEFNDPVPIVENRSRRNLAKQPR
jgi:hypothetical protein